MSTTEDRIESLENQLRDQQEQVRIQQFQVRRQRRWNIALGAVVVGGGLMAATGVRSVPDVIEAKQFQVINTKGNVVARIGYSASDGSGRITTYSDSGSKIFSTHSSASASPPAKVSSRNHWVKENIERGRYIKLEDGTLWEVYNLDRLNCSLWLPLTDIVILDNPSNPFYPYKFIGDNEVVQVKLVGKK